MSIQFGRWNFDGGPVAQDYFAKADTFLAPYAPDRASSYTGDGVRVLYHAFPTTNESRFETQPHHLPSGSVLTWDGRLDNRRELIDAIDTDLPVDAPDVTIVAAAYGRWAEACFSRLLGDWALSVWNPDAGTLVLAKDFLGTRHLYYHLEGRQLTWSTLLDPLVLCGDRPFPLDEEYIAGWFSSFPAAHLSPFQGIYSVPPASFVAIHHRHATLHSYWDFDPERRIRYRQDAEYEAHFRSVLEEAVRRRLRSDATVFAELSGGMDSSSIVCIADRLLANGDTHAPAIETLSYFDDNETTWDERPFVARVEQQRGRTGFHIDASEFRSTLTEGPERQLLATPASALDHTETSRRIRSHLASRGVRVLLSGLGGDEALGGAPNPIPELADLITAGNLSRFAKQSLAWALSQRRPVYQHWKQTLSAFLPLRFIRTPEHLRLPKWLEPDFVKRNGAALHGYYRRLRFTGPQPSFQENLQTLAALRRQFACHNFPNAHYERRFPFLDRDLWEFVAAIPREQLLRPGERRSLLRRALTGIVPDEIRNRRRKAFLSRRPFITVLRDWSALYESSEHLVSCSMGIVDAQALRQSIESARRGEEVSALPLLRMLLIELWLRRLNENQKRPVPASEKTKSDIRAGAARIASKAISLEAEFESGNRKVIADLKRRPVAGLRSE